MAENLDRRNFFKRTLAASAGLTLAHSFEERALLAASREPVSTSAMPLPRGRIKDVEISRLFCGGNLTSGFAHSRDLIYVSNLLNHYFTDDKIFETWRLCEESGINTAILRMDNKVLRLINKYWHEVGGEIQWICQIKITEDDLTSEAMRAIDNGAVGVYIHGGVGDRLVAAGKSEIMGETLRVIKENGAIAGIAGHALAVPMAVEKAGLDPDFYMKTLNSANYWTAGPRLPQDPDWRPTPQRPVEPEYGPDDHDNIWSCTPEQTIEFMKKVEKPWIAYKVLGAGAIEPREGFEYAYANGADFLCVGMFDFQIQEDVQIAHNVLNAPLQRDRAWRS